MTKPGFDTTAQTRGCSEVGPALLKIFTYSIYLEYQDYRSV